MENYKIGDYVYIYADVPGIIISSNEVIEELSYGSLGYRVITVDIEKLHKIVNPTTSELEILTRLQTLYFNRNIQKMKLNQNKLDYVPGDVIVQLNKNKNSYLVYLGKVKIYNNLGVVKEGYLYHKTSKTLLDINSVNESEIINMINNSFIVYLNHNKKQMSYDKELVIGSSSKVTFSLKLVSNKLNKNIEYYSHIDLNLKPVYMFEYYISLPSKNQFFSYIEYIEFIE